MDLKRILEALLFVADTPLGIPRLANLVDTNDRAAVRQALVELMGEYQEREGSFEVVEVAGGYSFRTKPAYAQWIQKLGKQQVSRLSPAALETLAAIAYKQPVLRAEVERIRGVDVGGVMRMLMEKGLVQVVGRQDLPGKPLIYGTTKRFLEVFGLNSIKDLPTMEEMEALMGDMAEAEEGGEVTQIGDGKLPLVPAGASGGKDAGDDPDGAEWESDEQDDTEAGAAMEADAEAPPGVEPGEPQVAEKSSSVAEVPEDAAGQDEEKVSTELEPEVEAVVEEPAQIDKEIESEADEAVEAAALEGDSEDAPGREDDPGQEAPEPSITLVAVPGEPHLDDPPPTTEKTTEPAEDGVELESGGELAQSPEPEVSLSIAVSGPGSDEAAPEPATEDGEEPVVGEAAQTGADTPPSDEYDAPAEDGEPEAPKPGRVSVGFTVDGADEADEAEEEKAPGREDGESPERKD